MTNPMTKEHEEFIKLFTNPNKQNVNPETGVPFLDYWKTEELWSWHQQSLDRAVKKAQNELLDWFNLSVIGYPDEKQRFMVRVKKITLEELQPLTPPVDVKSLEEEE